MPTESAPVRFSGAVLTGGRSTRMGRDKALLEIDGTAMARRVVAAFENAGAAEIVAIGGDADALAALGLRVIADEYPGEGPLGGIITALSNAGEPLVVITACDMPWLEAAHVAPLVAELATQHDHDVAVSTADGVLQPLHAAWRASSAARVRAHFDAGERGPRRVIAQLHVGYVELGSGRWSRDVDTRNEIR